MNLLSDAAQSETWPAIKPQLTRGKVGKSKFLIQIFKTLIPVRPYTFPTGFLLFLKTLPKSTSLTISMSYLLLLKVLGELSALCSRRVAGLTLLWLFSRMSQVKPKRKPLL